MCVPDVYQICACHFRVKKNVESPGTGVAGGCELLDVGTGN